MGGPSGGNGGRGGHVILKVRMGLGDARARAKHLRASG